MSVIRSVIPRNVVHFQKGLSEADVVTGRLVERTLCFRLIRPLLLQFYRHYNSGHNGLSRGLGFGLGICLRQDPRRLPGKTFAQFLCLA